MSAPNEAGMGGVAATGATGEGGATAAGDPSPTTTGATGQQDYVGEFLLPAFYRNKSDQPCIAVPIIRAECFPSNQFANHELDCRQRRRWRSQEGRSWSRCHQDREDQ